MNDLVIARIIHVVGVIWWLGGVAMVTTVIIPMAQKRAAVREGFALFEEVERYFVNQARIAVILVGLSGFYMTWRMDIWVRFTLPQFWWMHLMVGVWAFYVLMLFFLEPLMARKICHAVSHDGANPLSRMVLVHRVLLAVSVVAAAGAVGGPHGLVLF